MVAVLKANVSDASGNADDASTSILGPKRERRLLEELADCKQTLAAAIARDSDLAGAAGETDAPRTLSRMIAEAYASRDPVAEALDSVFQRYFQLRNELALANTRLVSSVAKRYRNRGIAYSDLLQEGFCGLLEAIDRFDLAHQTKLSTYATWWIRQAIQSAVAAGAYPVRLTPRHLRQLAQNQDELHRDVASTSIQQIHAATRPPVPVDETLFASRQGMSDPKGYLVGDLDEAIGKWMEALRPRERQVLSYRFGLGGSPGLSLSQVGKVLDVSKERARQIQDAALKMLRGTLSRDDLIEFN